IVSLFLVFAIILTACSNGDNKDIDEDNRLKIVSSFTIITDMAEKIGGDLVEVYNLVPTGTDPHDYEPMPDDSKAATDADILFYNGLNLEGGESGWFMKMMNSVGQEENKIFNLNEGVEPKYLTGEEGREEEVNPHSFIDPQVGMKMVENLRDALIQVDPDNEDLYRENGDEYLGELKEIDERYAKVIDS